MNRDFRDLLDRQSGVVARRQLRDLGLGDADIRRMVRRRELVRIHTGVYLNHTGPPSWLNRAWAAVLFHWPAALCDVSAVNLSGDVIHVAIDPRRTATRLPGVRVHRLTRFENRVLWNLSPPRDTSEEALLDVAAQAASRSAAPSHRPWQLAAPGLGRRRGRRPVGAGGQLPPPRRPEPRTTRGQRQTRERTEDGTVYRDLELAEYGLVIELDGRTHFEDARTRWRDMDRDLLAATKSKMTLRLGWIHCEELACRTAARLARVLADRGWTGAARACGPSCKIGVEFRSPRDWNSTA